MDPALKEKHLYDVWHALEREIADRRMLSLLKKVSIAATLVAILGAGIWYAERYAGVETEQPAAHAPQPIQAGREPALHTIADGRIITLERVHVETQRNGK